MNGGHEKHFGVRVCIDAEQGWLFRLDFLVPGWLSRLLDYIFPACILVTRFLVDVAATPQNHSLAGVFKAASHTHASTSRRPHPITPVGRAGIHTQSVMHTRRNCKCVRPSVEANSSQISRLSGSTATDEHLCRTSHSSCTGTSYYGPCLSRGERPRTPPPSTPRSASTCGERTAAT